MSNRLGSLVRSWFGRPEARPIDDPVAEEAHDLYLVQNVPHLFEAVPEKQRQFHELYREYRAHHGKPWDPNRVLHFMYLMDIANKAPPGDYIELGTHRGLTARLIWKLMDSDRTLYLLDTFEGFVEEDLIVEKKIYANDWHVGNFLPTSPEFVSNFVTDGRQASNLKPIKGWFPESYAGLESKTWRFVHIDFDLYQPIKTALETCWPQLVPGGVVVVHDYGCFGFPGAKMAVDEFFDEVGLTPQNLGDRWGSVAVIKPRGASGHRQLGIHSERALVEIPQP
jgi:predicted O-methyltransferase YrrM